MPATGRTCAVPFKRSSLEKGFRPALTRRRRRTVAWIAPFGGSVLASRHWTAACMCSGIGEGLARPNASWCLTKRRNNLGSTRPPSITRSPSPIRLGWTPLTADPPPVTFTRTPPAAGELSADNTANSCGRDVDENSRPLQRLRRAHLCPDLRQRTCRNRNAVNSSWGDQARGANRYNRATARPGAPPGVVESPNKPSSR